MDGVYKYAPYSETDRSEWWRRCKLDPQANTATNQSECGISIGHRNGQYCNTSSPETAGGPGAGMQLAWGPVRHPRGQEERESSSLLANSLYLSSVSLLESSVRQDHVRPLCFLIERMVSLMIRGRIILQRSTVAHVFKLYRQFWHFQLTVTIDLACMVFQINSSQTFAG